VEGMDGTENWTALDWGLALLIAYKGHDAARSVRRESRQVRRNGVRYNALRGSAGVLDKAAESPIEAVNAIRGVTRQLRSKNPPGAH
jgi:hypothetical protein